MSLADQIRDAYVQDGNKCSVGLQKKALNIKQQAELEEYLAGPVSSTVLLRACKAEGYNIVTLSGIRRHRHHDCLCWPENQKDVK